MNFEIKKATKKQAKLRLALIGVSGSGKTYTALQFAKAFGGKVGVIDTEHGSASKYADLFGFDVIELESFNPRTYVEAIEALEKAGYDVIVVDSLSHAWSGKDGALETVDNVAKRSNNGNSFAAWRDVTPMHNDLVNKLTATRAHLIITMRQKTEYILERDEKTGKTTPRKVGLAPIQRDGLEYEFDVVADLNLENDFIVSKTRCPKMSGYVTNKAGAKEAEILKSWLSDGAEADPMKPLRSELVALKIEELKASDSIDQLNARFKAVNKSEWTSSEYESFIAACKERKTTLQEGAAA